MQNKKYSCALYFYTNLIIYYFRINLYDSLYNILFFVFYFLKKFKNLLTTELVVAV